MKFRYFLSILFVGLVGCQDNVVKPPKAPPANIIPTIKKTDVKSVFENSKVSLTVEANDRDGEIVEYTWTQTTGEAVEFTQELNSLEFIAPNVLIMDAVKHLSFTVSVEDDRGDTASETFDVTVLPVNEEPVVSFGFENQPVVHEGETIVLSAANSFDIDGDVVKFTWQQKDGPLIFDKEEFSDQVSIVAPIIDKQETANFDLTIADNEGAIKTESFSVLLKPQIKIFIAENYELYDDVTVLDLSLNTLSSATKVSTNEFKVGELTIVPEQYLISAKNSETDQTMWALCNKKARQQCEVSPISSLVVKYAQLTSNLLKPVEQWQQDINNKLGIILPNDPYFETTTSVDTQAIDEYITNASLVEWLDVSSDYLTGTPPTQTMENWFSNIALPPSITLDEYLFEYNEQLTINLGAAVTIDSNTSVEQIVWENINHVQGLIIDNQNELTTTVQLPTVTEITPVQINLTIEDGLGYSTNQLLEFNVLPINLAPELSVMVEDQYYELNEVSFTVTASDNDGVVDAFNWQQLEGSNVNLVVESDQLGNTTSYSTVHFLAPNTEAQEQVKLLVTATDNENEEITQEIIVNVFNNTAPKISLTPEYFFRSNDQAVFDASNTVDAEQGNLDFQWQVTGDDDILDKLGNVLLTNNVLTLNLPEVEVARVLTLNLTVSDGANLSDEMEFHISLAPRFSSKVADTGIVLCGDIIDPSAVMHNYSNSIDCYNEDGTPKINDLMELDGEIIGDGDAVPFGQDGQYRRRILNSPKNENYDGWNGMSYTKLDAQGKPLPYELNNWSCILDNVTGLMWEVKTNDGGLRDKDWTYTWYNPIPVTENASYNGIAQTLNPPEGESDTCVNEGECNTYHYPISVNEAGLCGYNDWRVPTLAEVISLNNYAEGSQSVQRKQTIDSDFFPYIGLSTIKGDPYFPDLIWTSTTSYDPAGESAWMVGTKYGFQNGTSKTNSLLIRLVR